MNRRFPGFSLLSLAAPFLFGFASYPIWLRVFGDDPTGKAGMFIVLAALMCAVFTAAGGALAGTVFAIVAHSRRERFVLIRAFSLLVNLAVLGYGLHLWLSLPRA
jgi:hypothetical protein